MDPCQLCYEWILLAVCSDSTAAAEQTLPCSGTDNIWRRGGAVSLCGIKGAACGRPAFILEGRGALDSAGVSNCISTGAKCNVSLWIFSGIFVATNPRGLWIIILLKPVV